MILAGDIGGTNSRLALFDPDLRVVRQTVTKNKGRDSFTEIVREFLDTTGDLRKQVDRACFGVAGPVADGAVTLTNLKWHLEEATLASDLGLKKVALINDMLAHAEGVERLQREHVVMLNEGEHRHGGNRGIIAAGTGLGEAGLFWDAQIDGYRGFASEGGHGDFGPRSEKEIALLRFLQKKIPNVTWESVLSGPGLRNIYDFLCTPEQMGPKAVLPNPDPPPADITQAALDGSNPAAVAAMDMFIHFYGAEAGNLALKLLAIGGMYLGGGIVTHIVNKLKAPAFLEAFQNKGPAKLRDLLRSIPVYVIDFDLNGLYGAANFARRM